MSRRRVVALTGLLAVATLTGCTGDAPPEEDEAEESVDDESLEMQTDALDPADELRQNTPTNEEPGAAGDEDLNPQAD